MTPHPLIDPVELNSLLHEPPQDQSPHSPLTVLDTRWSLGGPSGRPEHAAGHVPGAVFVDLDADICGPPGARGRHPLPDPAHLQAMLRRVGIPDHGARVVVYDGGDGLAAARTWWTLRWAGLSYVRVLDGGFPAWQAAGFPVNAAAPDVRLGDVVVRPGGMPVADATGAAELARQGRLIDVRAPERYSGESEPIDAVAGHIPGAVNGPADEIGPDGRFVSTERCRERCSALGVAPDTPTGVCCGSGITAARAALAMTAAGLEPVLYVGSWSDWITDPKRPIATGPNP